MAAVLHQPVCSWRYSAQELQGLKRISGDAITQGCSRTPVRSERYLVTVLQPVRPEEHLAVVLQRRLGVLGEPMAHQGRKLSPENLLRRNRDSLQAAFFSGRGQIRVRFAKFLATLPPPSYHHLSQDMSVTLVAYPLISPRSRTSPLIIPNQRVGQIWLVQIP